MCYVFTCHQIGRGLMANMTYRPVALTKPMKQGGRNSFRIASRNKHMITKCNINLSVEILNVLWFLLLGSSQVLQQEALRVLYPEILSTESIVCDCNDVSCDAVYWFRITSGHTTSQFIGRYNNANRANYGQDVDEKHFKFSRRNTGSFTLRIINITEEDTGIYSCVLKDRKTDIWKPGILLRPGGLYFTASIQFSNSVSSE